MAEERLAQYETLEVKLTSRNQALRKLSELKAVERSLYNEGKLTRVPISRGYAMTTYPKRFKDMNNA